MLRSTCGMGLAAMKPSFLRLARVAGDDAVQVLAFVDIAEVAARVLRVLALGPEAAAVGEADLGILLGQLQHVRVEVAERRGEEERRAVLLDHRAHGLLHVHGLGDLLLLDDLDARQLLDRGGGLGLGLVVAVVVARADVDDAHDQLVGGGRPAHPPGGQRAQRSRRSQVSQRFTAAHSPGRVVHPWLLSMVGPTAWSSRLGRIAQGASQDLPGLKCGFRGGLFGLKPSRA